MRQWMALAACIAPFFGVLGCGEAHSEPDREQLPPLSTPSHFDSATAGTIRGNVIWTGSLPNVPPYEIRSLVTAANPPRPRPIHDNPNAPTINAATKAVGGAVVFLRRVDLQNARPWDYPPVTIEHHDRRLVVAQGDARTNFGFVRRGSAVTMLSRETLLNALHASGAAFFTLMFPDLDQPLTRVLKDQGVVELSSAVGFYWMRAYLFVDDHPYYTRTDANGQFELGQVPPGRYQMVCWMPNWHQKSEDRDPESGLVTRITFHSPLELEREVVIEASGDAQVEFAIHTGLFVK